MHQKSLAEHFEKHLIKFTVVSVGSGKNNIYFKINIQGESKLIVEISRGRSVHLEYLESNRNAVSETPSRPSKDIAITASGLPFLIQFFYLPHLIEIVKSIFFSI